MIKKVMFFIKSISVDNFPVWLLNRFISVGLEPVFSHTEISCIASNNRQYSTNNKKKKNNKT